MIQTVTWRNWRDRIVSILTCILRWRSVWLIVYFPVRIAHQVATWTGRWLVGVIIRIFGVGMVGMVGMIRMIGMIWVVWVISYSIGFIIIFSIRIWLYVIMLDCFKVFGLLFTCSSFVFLLGCFLCWRSILGIISKIWGCCIVVNSVNFFIRFSINIMIDYLIETIVILLLNF